MNILVTGAAGLIGSHLVDFLLDSENSVVGVDNLSFGSLDNLSSALKNKRFSFIERDLSHNLDIDDKFDVIYHMASLKKVWDGSIRSNDVMAVNFLMTQNLVEKSIRDNSFLIFSSTSDIYGNSETFLENHDITMPPPRSIRYAYALSKWHSEQYIMNSVIEDNLKACVARVFGCASYRSSKTWSGGHVPLFINLALQGKDIVIHGTGKQTRSISSAVDIAQGFHNISYSETSCSGEIVNLGTNEETTVLEVAEYIIKKTQSESKIIFDKNALKDYKEINRRFANTKKARDLIGFEIKKSTFEVIDEMIQSATS